MDPDVAYQNSNFIPGSDDYPARWERLGADWRAHEMDAGRARLNLPYGDGPRQRLDLFYPSGKPKGLLVFVHGGYWLASDNKSWSHLSRGATQRGWAVALPSYTLAPEARIAGITREIADAVSIAARAVRGPIVLSGHSAGGHLVARLLCPDVALDPDVAARLHHCVPISPISDLVPLLSTAMNADLRLDPTEATAESPVTCKTPRKASVTVWVGAEERPVFLDQARWLVEAWSDARLHVDPGRHHFDVIEPLELPDSPLTNAVLQGF